MEMLNEGCNEITEEIGDLVTDLRYECPEDNKDALQDCKCSINSSLRFR